MSEERTSSNPLVRDLPETIGPDDVPNLNRALEALLTVLRHVRSFEKWDHNGRGAAVVSLNAVVSFLRMFRAVSNEALHTPLLNLASAVAALDNNKVERVLKPTKRKGRPVSSIRRFALIGISVGAALRLESAGMEAEAANKQVADKLVALGIKPMRGSTAITSRTLRGWRERVEQIKPLIRALQESPGMELSAEDLGWICASDNVDASVTEEWSIRLKAMLPADARKFVLDALELNIREMKLDQMD
jgi:hypothetical protein